MSTVNRSDLVLAHQHRLSLHYAPRQSNFRVVALVFLEKESMPSSSSPSPALVCWEGDRPYLLGTNAEACWIGNSICAERSALTQLRWYPSARVAKIVIVTDAPDAITPGMLCREFMASSDQVPWDTRIVLGGTKCRLCKREYDQVCTDDKGHDFLAALLSLRMLYPQPSLYARLNVAECVAFGTKWQQSISEPKNKLFEIAQTSFQEHSNDLHPISYVAAVLFQDNTYAIASSVKLLEYGCSLDAVTQLAPALAAKRIEGIEPTQLVQIDQFSVAHAPFAQARAFLVERGYGRISVWSHDHDTAGTRLVLKTTPALDLAPMVPDFVQQLGRIESVLTA